jgi:hypothetical protein
MNINEILAGKLSRLPAGDHVNGLRAVKSHIDAAMRHLHRGQNDADEALFTDVVFRCNQAFEGSIKEAYRVLAGKDPKQTTPAKIETFLASSNLLKKRVLDQFTTYRQEWRNPSTHDYTLDFDEDEALVAIVSVTVFAIVLCDQIDGKIAFDNAAASSSSSANELSAQASLLDLVTNAVQKFASEYVDDQKLAQSIAQEYYRQEGALAGYLHAALGNIPGIVVDQAKGFGRQEADVVVAKDGQQVVVELKRGRVKSSARYLTNAAVDRVSFYLHEEDVVGAVVLVYLPEADSYEITNAEGVVADRVRIVAPSSDSVSSG